MEVRGGGNESGVRPVGCRDVDLVLHGNNTANFCG